jgi:hypothetical protein
MNLLVFGSRTLVDQRVEMLIREVVQARGATRILTAAEPKGVCDVARRVARAIPLPLTVYFLDFHYLRGAFEHRSKAALQACDFLLLIHDGKSKGTSNEHALAKKMGVPFDYRVLEPVPVVHQEEWGELLDPSGLSSIDELLGGAG